VLRCEAFEWPSLAEKADCEADNGVLREVYDDKGCTIGVECMTLEEVALQQILEFESSSCPNPPQALVDATADCFSNNIWDVIFGYDNNECIESVECE
jgi:hypothetical protein